MLRAHPIYKTPKEIDPLDTAARIPTPAELRDLKVPTIKTIPLGKAGAEGGWCNYAYSHGDSPELEVLAGGVNEKTPKASAIMRVGNLLHFGFEPSPDRMNDEGKVLLLNSICYISRFTEDRPILRSPCVFIDHKMLIGRASVMNLVQKETAENGLLSIYLSEKVLKELKALEKKDQLAWVKQNSSYFFPDKDGKLLVDTEAKEFAVANNNLDFAEKASAALADPSRAVLAAKLLHRYIPDGPLTSNAKEWSEWITENRGYMFFSDTGGYHWYIDGLAKTRKVPTASLRGEKRATLPWPPKSAGK